MKNNDKNFYIDSLEEENEKIRRELRDLKEDMRDLAFKRFVAERKLERLEQSLDLNDKVDNVNVSITQAVQTSFLQDSLAINIRIQMSGESSDQELVKRVKDFVSYIEENSLFNIDKDKVKVTDG